MSGNQEVTFERAFGPWKTLVEAPALFELSARAGGLGAGRHQLTVFDWTELEPETRAMVVECHLLELAKKAGKGWDAHLVPIGIVDGESHPIPFDELDQQSSGVLLLDLRDGGAICLCDDPTSTKAAKIASSIEELSVSIGERSDEE
jgi:hypothetical protein